MTALEGSSPVSAEWSQQGPTAWQTLRFRLIGGSVYAIVLGVMLAFAAVYERLSEQIGRQGADIIEIITIVVMGLLLYDWAQRNARALASPIPISGLGSPTEAALNQEHRFALLQAAGDNFKKSALASANAAIGFIGLASFLIVACVLTFTLDYDTPFWTSRTSTLVILGLVLAPVCIIASVLCVFRTRSHGQQITVVAS